MLKTDSDILINSKSTVYAILEHEKYESRTIPINSNTLLFKDSSLNENFNFKLFTDTKGNLGEEFKRSLRYWYSYTTISLLLLLFFSIMLYNQQFYSSSHLIVSIISIIIMLLISYTVLFLIVNLKIKADDYKLVYFFIIILKILFFIFLDKRVFCRIVTENCDTERIPLSYLIIVEIIISRIILLQSFIYLTILGVSTLIVFIIAHLYILSNIDFAYLSELSLIGLIIFVQIIECNSREIRMKHIFWREDQEDLALAGKNIKKCPINSEQADDASDKSGIHSCDIIIHNLKYISKIAIYNEVSSKTKDTIKELRQIKKMLCKNNYPVQHIEIDKSIDEQDYAFLSENFMEVHSKLTSVKSVQPPARLQSLKNFPFASYGISELQSVFSYLGKSWNFDIFFVYDSTGKSVSIASSYVLEKWGVNDILQINSLWSANYFQKVEEVKFN